MREVTKPGGKLIVSTPVELAESKRSYARFVGDPAQLSWWVPSPEGLLQMFRMAGFNAPEWIGSVEVQRMIEPIMLNTMGIVHGTRE